MTSGVRQALPQIAAQQPGSGLRGLRGRTPEENFADALGIGKPSRETRAEPAKVDPPKETSSRTAWPHTAAKFDSSRMEAARPEEELDNRAEGAGPDEGHAPQPAIPHIIEPAQPRHAVFPGRMASTETAPEGTLARRSTAFAPDEPLRGAEGGKAAAGDDKTFVAEASEPRTKTHAAPIFPPLGPRKETVAPGTELTVERNQAAEAGQRPANSEDMSLAATAEPARTGPRVVVVAQQSIPAPMPSTTFALVQTISASDLLAPSQARLTADAMHAPPAHASAQSLKLQLHPAELGVVTATLRFAGEQLSIELQVENHEAYRRLAGDSDAIVSSLRNLGYEVDRVTVLQPQLAISAPARTDSAAATPASQDRSLPDSGSGSANGGGSGSGGKTSGNGENAGHNGRRDASPRKENPGSGLYI